MSVSVHLNLYLFIYFEIQHATIQQQNCKVHNTVCAYMDTKGRAIKSPLTQHQKKKKRNKNGNAEIAGLDIAVLNNGGLDIDGLDNGGLDIDGLDIAGLDIVGLDIDGLDNDGRMCGQATELKLQNVIT